jgi:hypothetical protein
MRTKGTRYNNVFAPRQGHLPEQVKAMKDALAKLKAQGINSLNDE